MQGRCRIRTRCALRRAASLGPRAGPIAGLGPAGAGAAVPSTSASTYGTDGDVNAIATLGDTVYLGGAFDNIGLDTGGGAATAAADGQADAAMPAVTGTVQAAGPPGSGGVFNRGEVHPGRGGGGGP